MIIFINYINMCIQRYKQTLAGMDEKSLKRELKALNSISYLTSEINYKINLIMEFLK